MIKSGLVSVTFRQKTPQEIVALCSNNGIEAIEWGSDIHVPPSQPENALAVKKMCDEANIAIASYGTYYRCENPQEAEQYVQTACLLQAPNLRVWAGTKGSDEASDAYKEKIVRGLQAICTLAQQNNVTVSLEYHNGTLADTKNSALQLLEQANCKNLHLYWQEELQASNEKNFDTLQAFLYSKKLLNIHVFAWDNDNRNLLKSRQNEWQKQLRCINENNGFCYALLEFVKDDSEENFAKDAQTLNNMLANL